jgi:hypothetical protein
MMGQYHQDAFQCFQWLGSRRRISLAFGDRQGRLMKLGVWRS